MTDVTTVTSEAVTKFFTHIDSTPEIPMYGGHKVHCKVNCPISSDASWFGVVVISLKTTDENRVIYNNVNDGSLAAVEIHSRIETHSSDPNWQAKALPNVPDALGTRKRTMHINDVPTAIAKSEVADFIVQHGTWTLIS
jgi:hypothetical protein